jgi:hypothetical protein
VHRQAACRATQSLSRRVIAALLTVLSLWFNVDEDKAIVDHRFSGTIEAIGEIGIHRVSAGGNLLIFANAKCARRTLRSLQ